MSLNISEPVSILFYPSSSMARFRLPKFNEWENDNTSYSPSFERINPNDSMENPKASLHTNGESSDSSKLDLASKRNGDGKGTLSNRTGAYDHHKSTTSASSHKRMALESGSEKSNPDYSLVTASHRRVYSSQRKAHVRRSNSSSSSVSGQFISTQKSNQLDSNKHHRRASSSIPKFGEWDETDPTSGEMFTAIYSRVKEEKTHVLSDFDFPISNYSDQSKHRSPSWYSKICRCLASHGKD
ncbi:hypothetical protein J1N35_039516 [Gossypium stocksii]|uniref:RIN4 pathogenic type III effector avirulence factor Avr cleavage site domain-containing protein n=1 Tax=Gossypium stocksii TaxID=47602 RepID=A0A9D3UNY0_9ROSI|nr:hypothetical protein J1N35_039516 [Gossypium stocksii]